MLLLRVAAGNAHAFERLYVAAAPKLFGLCRRILPDLADAEEALQESFLAIWRRARSFDPELGSAMAWMLTVSRNCAIDRLRARKAIVSTTLDMGETVADCAPAAAELIEQEEDRRRLLACIGALQAGDQVLIHAAFYEGSTYAELAIRAARPLGTVKSRIRRALATLADCLR